MILGTPYKRHTMAKKNIIINGENNPVIVWKSHGKKAKEIKERSENNPIR